MEGGIVPNAASGIEMSHFPSQCRPQDELQQLAERMEKLQQHGGQLGADCSTDRAVAGAGRGTEYGRLGRGGGGRSSGLEQMEGAGWPSSWSLRSRSWGSHAQARGAPQMWEEGSAEGSKLPPIAAHISPPEPLAADSKTAQNSILRRRS